MAVRRRGDIAKPLEQLEAAAPPSEAWLLRTLAELRREQRYADKPVSRESRRRRGVKR